MRFSSLVIRALRIALPIAAGWMLGRSLELAPALLCIGALSIALPLAGALLLRTSRLGEVTWKNYAAGYLMPWGYMLGRGKLAGIACACAVCWCFLLLAGFGAGRQDFASVSADEGGPSAFVRIALVGGWVIDGAALLYLLGVLSKSFSPTSSSGRSLLKLMAFLAFLIAASTWLALSGHPRMAALVAAGPPLTIAGVYGAWVLVVVTVGRNARWN